MRLSLITVALGTLLIPTLVRAQSGFQISLPPTSAVMINKDVQNGSTLERWAIVYDENRKYLLGNVFRATGGEPAFIYCAELAPPSADQKAFVCLGADRCDSSSCPGQGDWTVIAPAERPFVIPVSFVRPRAGGGSTQIGRSAGCYAAEQNGAAPGQFACGLRDTTGSANLDSQFAGEHSIQQNFWQLGFPLYLFDECPNVVNAYSNPAGFILFGLNLTATTIARTGTTLPLAGVLAHEVAHQFQFRFGWMDTGAPTVRPTELEADAFSGFYMALAKGWAFDPRSGYNGPLIRTYFDTLATLGDTNFTDRNHHGTPQERVAAGLLGAQVAEDVLRTGIPPTIPGLHNIFASVIGSNASVADSSLAATLRRVREIPPDAFTYPDAPLESRERVFPIPARTWTGATVTSTPSGFQTTPDGSGIVMINKDVQNGNVTERWAITYDEGTGVFLGNVFRSGGGEPAFVYCEEMAPPSATDKAFMCWGADKCDTSSCPDNGDWVVIASEDRPFVVPTSFFRPRVTSSQCDVPTPASGLSYVVNCSTTFVEYNILLPTGFGGDQGVAPGTFRTYPDCGEIGCDVEFDTDLGAGESLRTEIVLQNRSYAFRVGSGGQLQLVCERGC